MSEEELEQKADDYEIDCIADIYKGDVCELQYAYSATKLEQAFKDGYKAGQKENAELKVKLKEYEKKDKLYSYLEGRFVECIQSCTQEEKEKCSMFPEFCEGEHTKFVDIVELLNKKGEIR